MSLLVLLFGLMAGWKLVCWWLNWWKPLSYVFSCSWSVIHVLVFERNFRLVRALLHFTRESDRHWQVSGPWLLQTANAHTVTHLFLVSTRFAA